MFVSNNDHVLLHRFIFEYSLNPDIEYIIAGNIPAYKSILNWLKEKDVGMIVFLTIEKLKPGKILIICLLTTMKQHESTILILNKQIYLVL